MVRVSGWVRQAMAVLVAAGVVLALPVPGAAAAAASPLTTPWTVEVTPSNALPEYPRPQLVRAEWQNLNGLWQFAGAGAIDNPPVGQGLAEQVLVPYPIESGLSRVQRHEDRMWYRRTFTVPAAWSGRRVRLNFGAVSWEARVWVNGVRVGTHTGAYDPFGLDVTGALRAGDNEIIVGVYAPVDAAGIPIGKQRRSPGGIFYTAYSGIWQTVWLEPVNAASITRLDTVPDVPAGQLDLVVQAAGASGQGVRAEVLNGGAVVGSATGAIGAHLRIPVPDARLWTPDDPFLYDLRVTLTGTGGPNAWDTASSFAADVTWLPATPWWRSGATLTVGAAQSFRVTTPGYTDRYLRHQDGLARTDVVTAASPDLLKQDATFYVRRGLADGSCYSFESRDFPGHYLRHADFRLRKDARDGTTLFDRDATFCAQPPRAGTTGVSLASFNIGGHHVRHYAEAVYIAIPGGPHAYDAPASYDQDVTWATSPPWFP